jgi:hypothetical protein
MVLLPRRGTVWYVSDLLQSIVKKTNILDSPASFLLSVISAIHMENVTGYSALLTRRCQEARCQGQTRQTHIRQLPGAGGSLPRHGGEGERRERGAKEKVYSERTGGI